MATKKINLDSEFHKLHMSDPEYRHTFYLAMDTIINYLQQIKKNKDKKVLFMFMDPLMKCDDVNEIEQYMKFIAETILKKN